MNMDCKSNQMFWPAKVHVVVARPRLAHHYHLMTIGRGVLSIHLPRYPHVWRDSQVYEPNWFFANDPFLHARVCHQKKIHGTRIITTWHNLALRTGVANRGKLRDCLRFFCVWSDKLWQERSHLVSFDFITCTEAAAGDAQDVLIHAS